jgi:hypothetical protein
MTSANTSHHIKWGRWIGLLVLSLLLGCCWWGSGLWTLFPPLQSLWIDGSSAQVGKVELLVPGARRAGGVRLAPDGRHMVLGWRAGEQVEYVLWDLSTGQHQTLSLVASTWHWLDRNYVAVLGGGYHLLDARDGSILPLERLPDAAYRKPNGFQVVEARLRSAAQVYALERFGTSSSPFVITQQQGKWLLINLGDSTEFGLTRDELQEALNSIPHTEVPILGWGRPPQTNQRIYSFNRQFYMTFENVDHYERRVVIYTRDEQLVASTYQTGWAPYILGWAHDSSGVYFQLQYRAIGGEVPETPIFKLLPLTEEEARWAQTRTILTWVVVAGLAVGAVWWWWRRRRRMTR